MSTEEAIISSLLWPRKTESSTRTMTAYSNRNVSVSHAQSKQIINSHHLKVKSRRLANVSDTKEGAFTHDAEAHWKSSKTNAHGIMSIHIEGLYRPKPSMGRSVNVQRRATGQQT